MTNCFNHVAEIERYKTKCWSEMLEYSPCTRDISTLQQTYRYFTVIFHCYI